MKVAVDLFVCRKMKTGTAVYASELYRALKAKANETEGTVIVGLYGPPVIDRKGRLSSIANAIIETLWYQVCIPILAWVLRIDVVHFTANYGSMYTPCASVITVHDAIFLRPDAQFSSWFRAYVGAFWLPSIARATEIVTVSEYSAKEIEARLKTRPSVIYNGPGHTLVSATNSLPHASERYFLYVGMIAPHKNVVTVVRAISQMTDELEDVRLYLVGGTGRGRDWGVDRVTEEIERLSLTDRVVITGFVDMPMLKTMYAGAVALLLPSVEEGFGFTPLESMSEGCPPIVSDIPVLREVLQSGAEYAEPMDPGDWARAMTRLLDPDTRRRMVKRGASVLNSYSWEHTADEMMVVYERAMSGGRESTVGEI